MRLSLAEISERDGGKRLLKDNRGSVDAGKDERLALRPLTLALTFGCLPRRRLAKVAKVALFIRAAQKCKQRIPDTSEFAGKWPGFAIHRLTKRRVACGRKLLPVK